MEMDINKERPITSREGSQAVNEDENSPLIGPLIVALHVVYGGDSVEASDREDHVVNDLNGEVAARVVHVRYRSPGVGCRVVHLTAAHSGNAVESADHVDLGLKN